MSELETIIKQSINPFDTANFKKGNFWEEEQPQDLNVNSIHKEVLESIEQTLTQVAKDKKSRTIRLEGDSGSGKTHLLGRLKKTLNRKAFFAHIIASIQAEYVFQYTLRKTIESLMFIPEGETESQLLLWLKRIIKQQREGVTQRILGKRKTFINQMKAAYPSGIWNPNSFFSVLYALTQPDLYALACGWLKGDDLDDEDLKVLGAKVTIETEDDAMSLLANLSYISNSTLPIVLCFDEIDISHEREELLKSILRLNMIIQSQKLKNFLVILSVITNTWKEHENSIAVSLKAPINQTLSLKPITTEQIEVLWSVHLRPFHQQLEKQPESSIAPLTKEDLEFYFPSGETNPSFPSGKTNPRNALQVGHELIQYYKTGRVEAPDSIAAFKLLWREELKKIKANITDFSAFSSAELANMLQKGIETLKQTQAKVNIFNKNTSFGVNSFSFKDRSSPEIGIIWNEGQNLRSFAALMNLCDELFRHQRYDVLIFIRYQGMGHAKNRGYQRFQKIFQTSPNFHIIPDLDSVYILATYHSLYSFATNQNLTVGYETPDVQRLQELTRQSGVLNECQILDKLEVLEATSSPVEPPLVEKPPVEPSPVNSSKNNQEIKEYILNLVQTTLFIGRKALTNQTLAEFNKETTLEEIDQSIQSLIKEQQIKIVNPKEELEAQSISIIS
ncbi:MAG: ATP-binding protein [Cyanobacteria bacterium]|jgi:Cdc6-like AAA superfamily ATPase|nr:ATP-binding protein [Cyanobacteria bacterium GSL.Bin1]